MHVCVSMCVYRGVCTLRCRKFLFRMLKLDSLHFGFIRVPKTEKKYIIKPKICEIIFYYKGNTQDYKERKKEREGMKEGAVSSYFPLSMGLR